jgi:hypothetical protein
MSHEWPVAVAWFSRTSTTVAAASGVAPDTRFAPTMAVQARAPPPSDELAREALT